ncbi:SH3 domain-containing YSC84-like protein 1 [Hondaea fermentalgiana]|uniref:SH3 domain-containing YSC84-like protein 1 n=1 Tax=Hondaea fermentalgiana TaxID=2315210 RepID=A0A2R5G3M7_9STRA|nr:SH3 domain-containing YSC84-like protein 1 [Hondaea fermentalgiana]|eukprot:GBG24358.1 SH3 domain-containing YSC84-like protein 1 [Hondaea fermentalgiana]
MSKRFSLEGYTDKCIRMLNDMVNPKYVKADKQIPATLLRHCEGIAFITIFKAGMFMLGGNVGGGCVIAKVKDPNSPRGWRWSGPASVTVGGLGGGFVFGAEKIDSLIILNTKTAVRAFMGKGQVTLGGNVALAAGPVGREIEAHAGISANKKVVAAYSYSKAQGLFIGFTLEGALLVSRSKDNIKYYSDQSATAERILMGEIRPPLQVDTLHRELYAIHDRKGDYAALERMSGSSTNSSFPTGASSVASNPPSVQSAAPVSDLPPNWRRVFTADGKPYYHNTATNETSWEMPAPASVPAPPSSNPSQAGQGASPFSNAAPFQYQQQQGSQVPVAKIEQPSSQHIPLAQSVSGQSSQNPFQSASSSRSMATMPPRPARAPAPARNDTALAMYDYNAAQADELSFKANDRITVLDKSDANWWKCSVNGRSGMAPSNYLKAD